ncbi:MAG: hypothetical protein HC911_17810, partial [Chloroflexaceae bacterium]|nr:hypothetical protein [Chloroflexaceae bacterium]
MSEISDIPVPERESHAAALAKLKDPALQREAWQRAITTAPDGRITAAHVEQVVKQVLREAELTPAPAHPSPPNVIDVRPIDAAEPNIPPDVEGRVVELEQRLAEVQAILAAYQAQITQAQRYPPTSEQGTAVAPLLQLVEQVQ